ncbi:MAG: sulfite exporter TauE/SafE family protein [gamma proteobacterium symbiont of Bathyaustriella thionipta]|nr:sulfite exporter TauE/SafE family protein [gamma proteobacterium symbiont of Bathyaustriella thionipta]MCU7950785.1 sulfite exporter TauE/SafE family protein [gamma proteobacterium symbiont of Bathyaustriella thionipta]MCU7952631.1 sulfite exporter TauE/SafE family protein [gamma proteobacterium symbiont of Bathyaustriella thionipta]MCU7955849.1 sulfite exporter TauE/SafE family protein [gamma proteobacterium symbiont of Bathyaustriella thionipta]MCU7968665.1 sulfite exporter TauE/SafE famil
MLSGEQLILLFVSYIANTFSAFAGGGAGLIQLPMLIFLGLPFSIALATHKVASVALGIGATLRHLRSGNLNLKFSVFILLAGVPGVVGGGFIIVQVPEYEAKIALGLLTIALGVYSWLKPELGQEKYEINRDNYGLMIGGVVLCLIGVLNGSLTSGTGLFVTLWLVRWFGLDYKTAVAYTLVLVGVFWNGTGALTLGVLSTIQWDWLPALLMGSLLGGYTGAHLAIVANNHWIKRVFEIVTIAVGTKLILG